MAPAITSFTPSTADAAGGDQITITGTQLDTVDVFLVGTKQAQVVSQAPTTAVIRVPAQSPGAVKIFAIDNDTDTEVASATNVTITGTIRATAALTGAAKWGFQVDTSPAQDGSSWVTLFGLTNFQPALEQNLVDTSNYDDYDVETNTSWKSQDPTQYGWSCALTFDRNKYSGAYDVAQEALRAASDKGGADAIVHVRWFDRTGGPEAFEGFGTVAWNENGGATTDKSSVQATVNGKGARLSIDNPAA